MDYSSNGNDKMSPDASGDIVTNLTSGPFPIREEEYHPLSVNREGARG